MRTPIMGRLVALLTFLTLAASLPARADSPLTSTPFWTAYRDVPEVMRARDIERLDTTLGRYLLSAAAIDRKAAVINALSWSLHGRENAVLFREMLAQKYRTAPEKVDGKTTPEETFCLAYLTALDDYQRPARAQRLSDRARQQMPRSFTVAIVHVLVRAQIEVLRGTWGGVWPRAARVLDTPTLVDDMRPRARTIIAGYLRQYAPHAR